MTQFYTRTDSKVELIGQNFDLGWNCISWIMTCTPLMEALLPALRIALVNSNLKFSTENLEPKQIVKQ